MRVADNKAMVRQYYETIYNRRDLATIDRFLAPSFVSAGPGGTMDLAAHLHALTLSQAALPDLQLTIEEQVAQGETVVTRWSAHGTQHGVLFGIPPTGKSVTATAIHIHHLAAGKIIEQWEQFDTLGMLRQLGVLPPIG